MITKRRINNRPYNNYIDSAGKVVTKNQEKENSNNNVARAKNR